MERLVTAGVLVLVAVAVYAALVLFAHALCAAARRGDMRGKRLDERTLASLLTRSAIAIERSDSATATQVRRSPLPGRVTDPDVSATAVGRSAGRASGG
jgi:hypothetical protein